MLEMVVNQNVYNRQKQNDRYIVLMKYVEILANDLTDFRYLILLYKEHDNLKYVIARKYAKTFFVI